MLNNCKLLCQYFCIKQNFHAQYLRILFIKQIRKVRSCYLFILKYHVRVLIGLRCIKLNGEDSGGLIWSYTHDSKSKSDTKTLIVTPTLKCSCYGNDLLHNLNSSWYIFFIYIITITSIIWSICQPIKLQRNKDIYIYSFLKLDNLRSTIN